MGTHLAPLPLVTLAPRASNVVYNFWLNNLKKRAQPPASHKLAAARKN